MAVDKVNDGLWSKVKAAYEKFLYIDERIEETDLRHVVGVQATNGASLHFPSSDYGQGVGVYPLQAFLNHDCRSNTETMEHPDTHDIKVYASRNISKGEQVTTSYVNSSQPVILRRELLHNTWNFWCRFVL